MTKPFIRYPNLPDGESREIVSASIAAQLLGYSYQTVKREIARGWWAGALNATGDRFLVKELSKARVGRPPIDFDEIIAAQITLAKKRLAQRSKNHVGK